MTGSDRLRVVVIGATGEAERVVESLGVSGDYAIQLPAPTDLELKTALGATVDAVAVLLHDDASALRYCLAAEHLRPGLPMVVALFDKTAGDQLRSVVPGCRVTSPAEIALPALLAAAVSDGGVRLRLAGGTWYKTDPRGGEKAYEVPTSMRRTAALGRLLGQFKPHDSGSRLLLGGLFGLVLLLLVDTAASTLVLHETPVMAFHAAVRTVATVGPVQMEYGQPGYMTFEALAMLLTIALTAMFTAGIVEHLLSGRLIGLFGRRVIPQRGHVVVVGMGQVGVRLAVELANVGLAVVGVERDARAANVLTARALGIPVHIGDGSRRRVLQRVRLERAVAICAVASTELDNLAVCVTAKAVAPTVRVVMRAGNHDAIAETQSLFQIARVCDVTGLTADFVVTALRQAGTSSQRPAS